MTARIVFMTADRPEGHPWIEIEIRYPLAKQDDNAMLLAGEIAGNLSEKGYKNINVTPPRNENP